MVFQVREDPRKGVYIDAHEEVVADFDHVLRILASGERQRHTGCTEMNSRSSRSHTLFRLVVESQQHYVPDIHASEDDVDPAVLVATLNLVDLAGSESVRHTGATGLRQKEGGKINQSLLTLSRVIQTLSQGGTTHVNYRDSKLTRILQPSLSGNAGMAIICCATPAEGFLEETRSTLQFASRAKQIKTRAMVNEVLDDKAQLRRMSQELAALRRQQAEGGGGNGSSELQGKVETLQAEKAEQAAKIERLCNLIINTANKPAAGSVASTVDATNVYAVDTNAELLHLDVSPRLRRTKRSRDTWCPGEKAQGGLLDKVLVGLDENEDWDRLQKRRSSSPRRSSFSSSARSSLGASASKRSATAVGVPPCTPTSWRVNTGVATLTSPARARAQEQVAKMQERLASLEVERDEKAAAAEAAGAATARVGKLEVEVAELKEALEIASKAAVAEASSKMEECTEVPEGQGTECIADEKSREVEAINARLEEAMKEKEALQAELAEFCEYTVSSFELN